MTLETNTAGNLAFERTGLQPLGRSIAAFGDQALRFSIVIVLGWIGAMKFTAYEASAIEGLVTSSPLTAWLYGVFSLQTTSNLIGSIEVATALALVLAPLHRNIAIIGTAAATATFAVTLSFLWRMAFEKTIGIAAMRKVFQLGHEMRVKFFTSDGIIDCPAIYLRGSGSVIIGFGTAFDLQTVNADINQAVYVLDGPQVSGVHDISTMFILFDGHVLALTAFFFQQKLL